MALIDILRTIGNYLPWREESQKLDYDAQVDELANGDAPAPAKTESGVKDSDGQPSNLFKSAGE